MDDKQEFGQWLKEVRMKKGWSQVAMADALGVSGLSVSNYELGKAAPTKKNKQRIIKMLEEMDNEVGEEPAENEPEPQEPEEPTPDKEEQESKTFMAETFEEMRERLQPYAYDDKPFMEQMQDLGVEVKMPEKKEKPKITNIIRIQKSEIGVGIGQHVKINQGAVRFGKEAMDMIDGSGQDVQVNFGVGERNGEKVMIIWPEENGYKINSGEGKSGCQVNGKGLPKKLIAAGLEYGKLYRLKKGSGFFVGIPVDEGGG